MPKKTKPDKPELHLLHPDEITFESIMQMFRDLVGREPTPQELEEARREWDSEDEGDS
jgi:hypothetical protein